VLALKLTVMFHEVTIAKKELKKVAEVARKAIAKKLGKMKLLLKNQALCS